MYSINNINNYILLLYILIDDFSAEQWLITINYIQNKSFCVHNIGCVCTLYIYYVYINTHACIHLRKNICYVYILNIFIYI